MNHRSLLIISVLLFAFSAGMLYYGYSRYRDQVEDLEHSLEALSKPDEWQDKIERIRSGFGQMQSTVRSYNISGDHLFLEQFYAERDSLVELTDELSSRHENQGISVRLDSLLLLFESKAELYDSLLQIQYYKEVKSSLNEVTEINIPVSTYEVTEDEGNILQRLFSSRYSRKALQAKNDSIIDRRNRDITAYNRSVRALREKERQDLDSLAMTELELVRADMLIDRRIGSLIDMAAAQQDSISLAERRMVAGEALNRLSQLKMVLLGGTAILFLMMVMLLLQIRKAVTASRALRDARERAELLANGKQEFLATMSHEIRTPLTVISGMVRNLRSGQVPDKDLIDGLGNSVDHLHYVVNDVLDDARLERGDLVLQEVDFNPWDLMRELAVQFRLQCARKGLEFRTRIGIREDDWVIGDPVRLKQVLYNVVGNAIKFTDQGAVSLWSSVITGDDGPILQLRISDTGSGIPAEKLTKIFDRFDGSSEESRKHSGGAGIGLSISKRIVEQQNGTIEVKSTEGEGTRFEIRIPYKHGSGVKKRPRPEPVLPDTGILKGIKTVYLEDDPFIAELLTADLKNAGAEVGQYHSYEQFRTDVHAPKPDAYIIDLQLGTESGIGILQLLKKDDPSENNRSAAYIAVTANPYLREQALEAGFDEVLIKPVRSEELFAVLVALTTKGGSKPDDHSVPSVFDLSELEKASGGNSEFIKRMVNVFMTTSFAGATNLLTYAKNGNLHKAGATAHRLAPSFEQMGVIELAAMLRQIEEWSADETNSQRIIDHAAEIKKKLRPVIDELKEVSKRMNYERK